MKVIKAEDTRSLEPFRDRIIEGLRRPNPRVPYTTLPKSRLILVVI